MLKYITLFLFCLILTATVPQTQVSAQTKEKQKVELSISKKKVSRVKIHHDQPRQKATVKKNKPKKNPLLEAKRGLVRKIIRDHKIAIKRESAHHNTPPALVVGIIAAESSNNPKAVSSEGAVGLMQTMRNADKAVGITCDSKEGECSIKKGTAVWDHLQKKYKINRESHRLVAYNRGQKAYKDFLEEGRDPEKDPFVLAVREYKQLALLALNELQDVP